MLKHGKTEVCSQTNKLANDEKYWTPIFQFGFLPRTFCLPADTKLLRKVTPAYFFPHLTLSWPGVGEERRQRTVDCETSCHGSWLWHQGESVWWNQKFHQWPPIPGGEQVEPNPKNATFGCSEICGQALPHQWWQLNWIHWIVCGLVDGCFTCVIKLF